MQGGKSKVTAGVLAILLGAYGAHCLYLRDIKLGIVRLVIALLVQILASAFSFFTLVLLAFIVWGVVDGIRILTGKVEADAAGNPLV